MKATLIAAAAALALSGGAAFAQGGGGNGPAIGNNTTTSMGAPRSSPEYAAPRSAAVPGLPAQEKEAQQDNAAAGTQTNQGVTAPVQGPTNPITGRRQTD